MQLFPILQKINKEKDSHIQAKPKRNRKRRSEGARDKLRNRENAEIALFNTSYLYCRKRRQVEVKK